MQSRRGDVIYFQRRRVRHNANYADLAQIHGYRPLSRRLDRCDRVIQNESRDPFGGNVYYVTMQIAFLTRKFRNGERNLHCDIVHITTKWVSSLTLDCNGVFAIKAYICGPSTVICLHYKSYRAEPRRSGPSPPPLGGPGPHDI